MGIVGHLRCQQRRLYRWGVGCEYPDALVQVGVGGGAADRVVDGQLLDPSAVQEPADDQDRLLEAAQGPGAAAGAAPQAFTAQQAGHEQHGLLAHGQGGGVRDTHSDAGPL
jgi:hypothetical protein